MSLNWALFEKKELATRKTFRLRKDRLKSGRIEKRRRKRGEERRRRYRLDSQISNSEGMKVELRWGERVWKSDPFQIIRTGAATGGCSSWNRKLLKSDYQGRHRRTTFLCERCSLIRQAFLRSAYLKTEIMIYWNSEEVERKGWRVY